MGVEMKKKKKTHEANNGYTYSLQIWIHNLCLIEQVYNQNIRRHRISYDTVDYGSSIFQAVI